METRTVEQVENWSTRPFTDGYAGLRELSDGEFSGAVRAGGAWLFMLNGRIIGVFEGSLDDFQQADGTAYAAPHPSLPLLFSMQEQGGETQAKYYTNDTPLSEVDSTLSSGKFTGFVELSENVLSGDYYVAYYGGRSMSVAFVGASEQVVTGDEAFDRAKDEVGIYEVRDVDVEVTDVPEPEGSDEPSGAGAGSATGSSGATDAAGTADPAGTSASAGGGQSEEAGASPSAGANTNARPADDAGGIGSSAGESTPANASETPEATTADATGNAADAPTETAEASAETDASPEADAPVNARDDTGPADAQTSQTGKTDRTAGASASESAGTGRTTGTDRTSGTGRPTETAKTADADRSADTGRSADTARTTDAARTTDTASSTEAAIEEAEPATEADPGAESTSEPESETTTESAASGAAASGSATEEESDAFSEEAEWRETTTIPSLDPDRSEGPDDESEAAAGGTAEADRRAKSKSGSESASSGQSRTGKSRSKQSRSGHSRSDRSETSKPAESRQSSGESGGTVSSSPSGSASDAGASSASASGGDSGAGPDPEEVRERVQQLKSQLAQRKQQVEQLKERVSTLESERNEYKRERDALAQEVERLEAKLERTESGESGDAARRLSEAQAFDGTNLFVRYQSKGKSTLDEAAEGKVDADDVNANLRLEHHTQFEADDVQVAGESFEAFLTDSFEYRFVSWVIEELLYEIRETGHRNGLQDLYEAIPKIDRVDLHGEVSAGGADEDTRQESFDVIMRDRMGNPLLVADLNGSREPTTGDMMGSLVDAASGVGEKYDELSGAFQVTESFFEPEALETTETATSGGFLSREKRESFVKLSRKRGYHLCLVESRSGGFHLNVPEL